MTASVTHEALDRLMSGARSIIDMLESVLSEDEGVNYKKLLMYASGLAGFACQKAVIENNDQYVTIGTGSGRNYYFGDGVNAYLLENECSVLALVSGIYLRKTERQAPDPTSLIKNAVSYVGDDNYRIWNELPPDEAYKMIKECWDGIYENMTEKFCASPSEWPVLFALVLQNVLAMGMDVKSDDADLLYQMSLECALFISKMRDDSTAQ